MDGFSKVFNGKVLVFIVIVMIVVSGCASPSLKNPMPLRSSPQLRISCRIEDANGNSILEAGESAAMIVTVTNTGKGGAEDVAVQMPGFKEQYIGEIPSGQTRSVKFPMRIANNVQDGTMTLQIMVSEGRGYNPAPLQKVVRFRSSRPHLRGSCKLYDADGDGLLETNEIATMIVSVINEGKGSAKDVSIRVSGFQSNKITLSEEQYIGDIPSRQVRSVKFPLMVTGNVQSSTLTFRITITEGQGYSPEPLQKVVRLRNSRSLPKIAAFQETHQEVQQSSAGNPLSPEKPARQSNSQEPEEKPRDKKQKNKVPEKKPLNKVSKSKESDKKPGNKARQNSEDLRWKKAEQTYTVAAYQEYLKQYPKGRHGASATRRIRELNAISAAQSANSYNTYKQFVREWPESRWIPEAKKRITPAYWKAQLEGERNSHNYCQTAQALMGEKGQLGANEAEEYYRRAIQLDRSNEQAYLGLGNWLFKTKRYQELIALFEQAAPHFGNYEVHYQLAKAYESLGQHKQALESYGKALQLRPNYYQCLYDRAYLYWQHGRFGEAKEDFKKVVELKPGSILAKIAREYLNK